MHLSAANSALGGIAAAQTMFDVTARAAARAGASEADPSTAVAATPGASAPADVSVAVLRMALDSERSLVDIFA